MLARIAASAIYFIVVVPIGALTGFAGDPLRRRRPRASNWVALPSPERSLERAREMV